MRQAAIVQPLLASLGAVALALALGVIVVGYGVCLPLLADGGGLVDLNLGRALAAPIAARLADLLVGASLVAALCLPVARASAAGRAAAWALVSAAAIHRVLLAPAVADAWSRVDRLTMRPADLADEAARWTQAELGTLGAAGLLALALLALTTRPGGARGRDN